MSSKKPEFLPSWFLDGKPFRGPADALGHIFGIQAKPVVRLALMPVSEVADDIRSGLKQYVTYSTREREAFDDQEYGPKNMRAALDDIEARMRAQGVDRVLGRPVVTLGPALFHRGRCEVLIPMLNHRHRVAVAVHVFGLEKIAVLAGDLREVPDEFPGSAGLYAA